MAIIGFPKGIKAEEGSVVRNMVINLKVASNAKTTILILVRKHELQKDGQVSE